MYFQHLRTKKVKSGDLAIVQNYLTAHTSEDHAIENLSQKKLNRRLDERIAQLHLKKRPRSDATVIEDIAVGTSAGFMQNSTAELREEYFLDALHFFQRHYGVENILYCQCCREKSKTYVHIGIVPVTTDGRLSASSLFADHLMKALRIEFHREVAMKYGLARKGEHQPNQYLELCFRMKRLESRFETLLAAVSKGAQYEQKENVGRI